MAKVKVDVSDAEVRSFEMPKPGVYEAVVQDMEYGKSSQDNDMFTIVFEITKGEFKGSRIWYYILEEGQEWRLREFLEAVGLKPKTTVDTDAIKGVVVKIRTAIDPAKDGYDEKARIKNVMAGVDGSGNDEDEEDELPYGEWEVSELREEAEARSLKIEGRATKKKLIDALEADDGDEEEEEGDEEEEEEEDEEGDEITMSDLEEMDRAELKKLIAEEELEIKVMKKDTEDQLREKIAEALELEEDEEEEESEEEEEEEDSEDEEDDTDYEEWDVADLKKELKERGLKTEGRKSTLVKRLQKEDESKDEPF